MSSYSKKAICVCGSDTFNIVGVLNKGDSTMYDINTPCTKCGKEYNAYDLMREMDKERGISSAIIGVPIWKRILKRLQR